MKLLLAILYIGLSSLPTNNLLIAKTDPLVQVDIYYVSYSSIIEKKITVKDIMSKHPDFSRVTSRSSWKLSKINCLLLEIIPLTQDSIGYIPRIVCVLNYKTRKDTLILGDWKFERMILNNKLFQLHSGIFEIINNLLPCEEQEDIKHIREMFKKQ